MKFKKIVAIVSMLAMLLCMFNMSFADPTEDLYVGPNLFETTQGATGPEVEEYYVYKEDRNISPGSLGTDVDLNTVGKGLFFDNGDFYFYVDTGVMASNYMFTIEGDRFFFGEDGKMVKDELVSYDDEIYYFDENGAMYKNRWYTAEEKDESDNTYVYTDYYFGPTGRAYRALDNGIGLVVKTIDGQKFGFNVDGEKLEGYYDQNGVKIDPDEDPAYEDCVYYFDPDENGAAAVGWHYYEGGVRGDEYEEDEEIVLYFDEKTSKKVHAKASYANEERCISRIIDGQRYMFDHYGVRKNSWYVSEPGRASRSNMKYFNEEYDGYLQHGWFEAVPGSNEKNGEDLVLDVNKKRHSEDEDCWFYAGRNGNIFKKTIRKVGSHIYAFDDDGVMQQDSFVKVRNGAFVKAYETDNLTKANILFDPKEYGGNADPDPYGPSNPITLEKDKGLLDLENGEQWMFFLGDYAGEGSVGAQGKQNSQIKVELSDSDIYFIQNSMGGYSKLEPSTLGNVSGVVNRSGVLIQNGVVLRPEGDTSSYGIVRSNPNKTQYQYTDFLNYNNQSISFDEYFYSFIVVNSKGKKVDASYKSLKDSTSGGYIYIGPQSNFLGYYQYQGRYYSKTPGNLVDENGNKVPASNSPCWAYKMDGEKFWRYGMPPLNARLDCDTLFINFGLNSLMEGGGDYTPYNYGLASVVYREP